MLIIARLFPKIDINKVWDYVEHQMKEEVSRNMTPLYATQTEGMMDIGIIFDVKHPDDIAPFLTEEIVKCAEVHHTKTISLMKPVFFPIPKKKPENIQRYFIRLYMHPRYYKKIYDYLINYNYPYNLFPIYISYSLGDEDIIMSIAADSKETAIKFLKEHIRTLDGVDQSTLYPVFRAKRFAPLGCICACPARTGKLRRRSTAYAPPSQQPASVVTNSRRSRRRWKMCSSPSTDGVLGG